MDIRYLRSFIMVAQCLSFTEAAKRMFIGQSTISKQIADFEEALGVELLIRHHCSLELTVAGKTLLREGVNLLNNVAAVVEKTRQASNGIRGNLKIGCFGDESAFLPNAIKRFRALFPQIHMDIQILTLKMLEDALDSEELDLAFTVRLGNQFKADKFMQRVIYKFPLCFLLPSNHPYAGETSIDISAFANESFILLSEKENSDDYKWFIKFCEKQGFSPNIVSTTTQLEGIFWLVEAGVGISFWSKNPKLAHYTPSGISLVDMQGKDACANIVAIWKKKHNNPAIQLFFKVLETIDENSMTMHYR
ncbi:LysR family transcriptional regulator [Sporomusa termitida]|uniref:HTH-type transcriptional regulator GltC n=1 Tax=Sporomusa termitida TaxID=2377 RepID=A0A517DV33_9FIRM|nr:LysR family transcriptional regulator [Sporomusa termitida]QDR81177.1 HTH-type transcriptional regulator GltC [Sporomusa termitida]